MTNTTTLIPIPANTLLREVTPLAQDWVRENRPELHAYFESWGITPRRGDYLTHLAYHHIRIQSA
jgi:hypothetical protein